MELPITDKTLLPPSASDAVERFREIAERSLEDDKAEAVTVVSLIGKTSIADYMIIASGRSSRQVTAMADHLAHKLKEAGARSVALEGMARGDWVLIDAGDVIVHLFRPEVRAFYNLEKMWGLELPPEAISPFVPPPGGRESRHDPLQDGPGVAYA